LWSISCHEKDTIPQNLAKSPKVSRALENGKLIISPTKNIQNKEDVGAITNRLGSNGLTGYKITPLFFKKRIDNEE